MTVNGSRPLQPLEERPVYDTAEGGLSRVWSLAKAAQRITLRLAFDPDTDSDLSMTHAGMDIREALEELEWSHPDIRLHAVPVDFEELPREPATAREVIALLLAAALIATLSALSQTTTGSSEAEILMLGRVIHVLGSALGRLDDRPVEGIPEFGQGDAGRLGLW